MDSFSNCLLVRLHFPFWLALDSREEECESPRAHSSTFHSSFGVRGPKEPDTTSSSQCGARNAAHLHRMKGAQPTRSRWPVKLVMNR